MKGNNCKSFAPEKILLRLFAVKVMGLIPPQLYLYKSKDPDSNIATFRSFVNGTVAKSWIYKMGHYMILYFIYLSSWVCQEALSTSSALEQSLEYICIACCKGQSDCCTSSVKGSLTLLVLEQPGQRDNMRMTNLTSFFDCFLPPHRNISSISILLLYSPAILLREYIS